MPSDPKTACRPSPYQTESWKSRPGEEAGRPWPGPYQRCSTPMALRRPPVDDAGQVHRAHVLLVGVGEARPGVDRLAVHEQPVGVRGGDVGGGAGDACPAGGVDLGAQVGHAVGLRRGAGRAQPLGLPVRVAQRRW